MFDRSDPLGDALAYWNPLAGVARDELEFYLRLSQVVLNCQHAIKKERGRNGDAYVLLANAYLLAASSMTNDGEVRAIFLGLSNIALTKWTSLRNRDRVTKNLAQSAAIRSNLDARIAELVAVRSPQRPTVGKALATGSGPLEGLALLADRIHDVRQLMTAGFIEMFGDLYEKKVQDPTKIREAIVATLKAIQEGMAGNRRRSAAAGRRRGTAERRRHHAPGGSTPTVGRHSSRY